MTSARTQRRLAAILAADVVGYSRLMGQGRGGHVGRAQGPRTRADRPEGHGALGQRVQGHRRWTVSPSFRASSTPSPVLLKSSAPCSFATRTCLRIRAIQLRIGINLGDVIVEGDDVFGDGVNVAARIESIATPGDIAVSGTVRDHIGNRLDLQFEMLANEPSKI